MTARLGLASALRRVADSRTEAAVHRVDGSLSRGFLGRVGADFVEVRAGEGQSGSLETVPFGALAAVRTT